jgi:hypothetical protein
MYLDRTEAGEGSDPRIGLSHRRAAGGIDSANRGSLVRPVWRFGWLFLRLGSRGLFGFLGSGDAAVDLGFDVVQVLVEQGAALDL